MTEPTEDIVEEAASAFSGVEPGAEVDVADYSQALSKPVNMNLTKAELMQLCNDLKFTSAKTCLHLISKVNEHRDTLASILESHNNLTEAFDAASKIYSVVEMDYMDAEEALEVIGNIINVNLEDMGRV